MLDPFTFYGRIAAAAFDIVGTAQRAGETVTASEEVIARRTTMMGDAVRSPLDGNYRELSRMVPEKLDAFGKSGAAIAADWWAMHSTLMAQARHVGTMAMRGRAPTFAEVAELSTSNIAFALSAFERAGAMSAKGLKPIHASATGNARRLKRGH